MGIRHLFHTIKTGFERMGAPSLPYVDEAKRYGNYGEDEFSYMLLNGLPSCKIKRNVIVSTTDGSAEIDCLVLYRNKLFAIEVKRWKGQLIEQENGFLQIKADPWTGEAHQKFLKSPFRQIGRAVYLLRKQIPIKAWINTVVFFEDDELESVSVSSENIWFDQWQNLLSYMQNGGKASFDTAENFFDRCVPSDYIFSNSWGNFSHCIIDRSTLKFATPHGIIFADDILCIHISHHFSYDELHIKLTNGCESILKLENEQIRYSENGCVQTCAFAKLDYIEIGRAKSNI